MYAGNQLSTFQITVVASFPPNGEKEQKDYHYLGTMASDQARQSLSQFQKKKDLFFHPWGMIFNVDPIKDPGSHWLALYNTTKEIELFDSYGSDRFYHRYLSLAFLKEYVQIKEAPRLQSHDTYVCGHYCLAFLWHRARNVSHTDFVASFPGPPRTNDKTVCQFVCNEMIPKSIKKRFNQEYIGPLGHPCQGCCCEKEQLK